MPRPELSPFPRAPCPYGPSQVLALHSPPFLSLIQLWDPGDAVPEKDWEPFGQQGVGVGGWGGKGKGPWHKPRFRNKMELGDILQTWVHTPVLPCTLAFTLISCCVDLWNHTDLGPNTASAT